VYKYDNNYAFIDLQNLHLGTKSAGWVVDLKEFYRHLKEKYSVTQAYVFVGYVPQNHSFYKQLRLYGYKIIFKDIVQIGKGKIKGNCDVDLTLHTLILINKYDKAVLVTGDGDFYSLASYLIKQDKFLSLIVPNRAQYSILYKRIAMKRYVRFIVDNKSKLEKKRPHEGETS
jgi:uncharacterized LabA/DUF88 family protein